MTPDGIKKIIQDEINTVDDPTGNNAWHGPKQALEQLMKLGGTPVKQPEPAW